MNKVIVLIVSLFMSSYLFSQENKMPQNNSEKVSWEEMILRSDYSFQDIRKAFYEKWKDHNYVKDDGYKIFKRWEYWMEYFIDSTGVFDKNAIEKEYLQYTRRKNEDFYRESAGNWEQLGPYGFISSYGIGRVNVVAYDPNNHDVLWLGAPAGGLWKSTDRGESWTAYSKDFRMMGISDIAIDPDNTDIIYVATGDRDAGDTYTYGLMKTVDGGATWTKLNMQNVNKITRVLISPESTQTLVVATNTGIFKSTDGGNSWNKTFSGKYIKHMEYKPGDFNYIYATDYSYGNANSKFYRSIDAAESFETINIDSLPSTVGRIAIGVTKAAPDKVFLLAGINNSGWDSNDFEGIYVSEDSGLTFSQVEVSSPPDMGSQSWYDWTFGVSPENPKVLYAGGVNAYKSNNGGVSWNRMSNWNGDHFHVDHHYLGFQPGTNVLFVGNDGGVYYSDNKGNTWHSLNEYLSITQYYKISSASNNPELIIGGSQDNGTHMLDITGWTRVMGGDGMDCLIDYSNSNNVFASYQQGYLRKSINKGNNFHDMLNPSITNEAGAWVTPFVMDPVESKIMYAGFESIWKSIDKGDNWENISGPLYEGETIRGIAVAPSDNNYIYAFYLDKIFKSTDKGETWNEINKPNGNTIREIAISPRDKDKLWIAVNRDVFMSTDGGGSWINIDGTLPKVPMTSVVAQDNDLESVYLGTYIGVFYTDNTMTDWIPFNDGLPPVRIGELEIDRQFGKLRAGTFGRGMWQTDLYDLGNGAPLCTNLISPATGSKIFDESIELKWRNISNADGYIINIGSEEGGNDILDSLDVGNITSYTWDNIEYDGKVYIEIIPYNSMGFAGSCQSDVLYIGCFYEDKDALVEFYKKTGGELWKNKWDTTNCDISQWYGVKTNEEGRVVSLDLDGNIDDSPSYFATGNNLSGEIDSIIRKFEFLKSLYLGGNKLKGKIPSNISKLKGLQYLDLSNNDFSGEFPKELTDLNKLRYLDLSNNNFSGEINANFGNWTSLTQLNLANNNFWGKIPISVGTLKDAWSINMSNNAFSGSIPFQFWFLKSLAVLDLSNNNLTGKLSKQISGATGLAFLNLRNNNITNTIPESLGNKNWESFDIAFNDLEGCFPDNLKKLCGQSVNFIGNSRLPGNGDFNAFCNNSKGMCSKLPECSSGLNFENNGTDTLPFDTPVKWSAVENAKGYYLQLGTTSGGNDILDRLDVGSVTYFDAGELPKKSTIYVNLTPYNKYGNAYGCDEFTFTTSDISSGIKNDTLNFGKLVEMFPNPAKDFITVKKLSGDINSIDIEIYDFAGRSIKSKILERNVYKKIIDISILNSGVYFVKMNIDNAVYYKKLIVQ